MNISNPNLNEMDTEEVHETKRRTFSMDHDDQMEVEDNDVSTENEIARMITRILNAIWHKEISYQEKDYKSLFLAKDTMNAISQGSLSPTNYSEVISDIIHDIVRQYYSKDLVQEIEVCSLSDQIKSNKMRNDDIEMDFDEDILNESRLKMTKTCTAKEAALYYLIESYNRSLNEKNHDEIKRECRRQLINSGILLLDHEWSFDEDEDLSDGMRRRSAILQIMYDETTPYQAFVKHLMSELYNNHPKRFTKIFNVVLEDIYLDMRCKRIKSIEKIPTHTIDRLHELISMGLDNNENVKPICNLVVSHRSFMPSLCTDIQGREISNMSFLSPFLSISILVYDHYYDDNNAIEEMIQSDLQNKLEYVRGKLHKLFYGFIANKDTRETMLRYLSDLLKHNSKRVQFSADERSLAQDGFMINLMAVLQQLSLKIKIERIDPLYIFHPRCLVTNGDDTKLRYEKAEFENHMKKMEDRNWEDPKFVTQCWFMTLHSHHLGIIPAISRYHKRLRAIKELQRMVDEINATETRWKNTALARRNKNARDKWVNRIKKLTKAKNTMEVIIMDPNLNRNCLQFYSSVCEFILHHIEGREAIDHPFYNKIPPNSLEPSDNFSALPVWYIEDIADYLLFLLQ
jgi:ubiquitin conjugation factor E4 B